jgi:hypothetical protein
MQRPNRDARGVATEPSPRDVIASRSERRGDLACPAFSPELALECFSPGVAHVDGVCNVDCEFFYGRLIVSKLR